MKFETRGRLTPTPNIYTGLSLSSYGNHLPNECRFKMTNDSRFEIFSDQSWVSLRLISENYRFEMSAEGLSFRNDRPVFRFEMIDSYRHFEMIRIDYFRFILD